MAAVAEAADTAAAEGFRAPQPELGPVRGSVETDAPPGPDLSPISVIDAAAGGRSQRC